MSYKTTVERRSWQVKYRKDKRALISDYKINKCCQICGYNKDSDILVFHHINNKSFEIGHDVDHKKDILLNEIAKCILLCPNCHSIIHKSTKGVG